jgi:hypothetical protein
MDKGDEEEEKRKKGKVPRRHTKYRRSFNYTNPRSMQAEVIEFLLLM